MRYYNADGGEAEMCGNGGRCIAWAAVKLGLGHRGEVRFQSRVGIHQAWVRLNEGIVRLTLTDPSAALLSNELLIDGNVLRYHFINSGVPHVIIPTQHLEDVALKSLGPRIRYHEHFAPKGTNVNWTRVVDRHNLRIRTYERGVEDETLACGTGAVAAAVIHALMDQVKPPVRVQVRSGQVLAVDFELTPDSARNVTLEGPVSRAFTGRAKLHGT